MGRKRRGRERESDVDVGSNGIGTINQPDGESRPRQRVIRHEGRLRPRDNPARDHDGPSSLPLAVLERGAFRSISLIIHRRAVRRKSNLPIGLPVGPPALLNANSFRVNS